jgi:hypothetical protein
MDITAVLDTTEKFDIRAALSSPEIRGRIGRLMAKAGFAKPTCQFQLHELDAQLASSGLTVAERLECKVGLNRAGLIAA